MKLKLMGSYVIFFIFLLITESYAASSYKITDYIPQKFTDLEWRIGGRFHFSGNNSKYDRGYLDSFSIDRSRTSESQTSRTALENRFNYDYETIRTFVNFTSELVLELNYNDSYSKEEYSEGNSVDYINMNENDRNYKDYNLRFSSMLDVGNYLSKDLFVSGKLSCGIYHTDVLSDKTKASSFHYTNFTSGLVGLKNDIIADRDYNTLRDNVSIEFLPGWGHVYEGMYNSTALYIIEELGKSGLLLRELSQEEFGKLAELIYHNRLQHAIDFRLRRIEVFKELLDFLIKHSLINDSESQSMILITDIWDYFPLKRRQFGSKIKLGGGYEYDYNKYEQFSNEDRKLTTYFYHNYDPSMIDSSNTVTSKYYYDYSNKESRNAFFITGYYEYHTSISRKIQFDLDSQIKYYLNKDHDFLGMSSSFEYYSEAKYNRYISFDLNPVLTYIYNSRSMLTLTGEWQLIDRNYSLLDNQLNVNSDTEFKATDFDLSMSIMFDYRISIPTMLTASIGYSSPIRDLNFWRSNYIEDYDYNHRYNASIMLTHYIY